MSVYEGKNVLVTGGSRGLGLILARQLAKKGARVAICGRDAESLDRVKREFARRKQDLLALPCDVSDRHAVRDMVAAVIDTFGSVDVLINNAGIIQVGPFEAMQDRDFEEIMNVVFWGSYHAARAVLPSMVRRHRGRIINVVSIGGQVAVPHLLPYTSAKFALSGFSQGLRAEMRRHGVSVTTAYPGLMRTGSFLNALFKGKKEKEFAWFSWGSSFPLISLDGERAARAILRAGARNRAVVTVGIPAKTIRLAAVLLPGLTAFLMALVARLLPRPGKGDSALRATPGNLHRTHLSSGALTRLGDEAAKKYNNAA